MILYIVFYTPEYESIAKRCEDSLNMFGLKHVIEPIANKGSWKLNTEYTPEFLLKMMALFPEQEKFVCLDADAVVNSNPELFKTLDCDLAIRFQDFQWRSNECLNGTTFFKNNIKTKC